MYYNENELPAILTFAEAVEYLYIGRNTLLKLLHNGTIKGFKVGNRWRIKKEDLLEFMNTDRLDRIKPYNVILFCRIDTSEQ